MQFKVPQFIDIEDKLFGPFTFSQFAYLIGGGGMVFIIIKLLPLWIGIFLIIPVASLALLLVFYKMNGKPFIYYLQAGVAYLISNKLYIWRQRLVKPGEEKEEVQAPQVTKMIPTATSNNLENISWSLDVDGKETTQGGDRG